MSITSSIDGAFAATAGPTIYSWLGSFWARLVQDKDFIKTVTDNYGLFISQLYLNFIELLDLRDRTNAPVFHRERYFPVIISRKNQNNSKDVLLSTNMPFPPKIGPQTEAPYPIGAVFKIGKNVNYKDIIYYPLDVKISDVLSVIVDNPITPKIILLKNIHFIVKNRTIFFKKDCDPFTINLFPKYFVKDSEETVLWFCDVLIDQQYLQNHFGYILNLNLPSSEFYKKIINAFWNVYNFGPTLKYFIELIAAIFNAPISLYDNETVTDIVKQHPVNNYIVTNKHVYPCSKNAKILVSIGETLHAGQLLTDAVRIYTNIDIQKRFNINQYQTRFADELLNLYIPATWFNLPLRYGIGVEMAPKNLVVERVDNGTPRLSFDLFGDKNDLKIFWESFWKKQTQLQITNQKCFNLYLYENVPVYPGAIVGKISPLVYFFENFLQFNLIIVIVDTNKLLNNNLDVSQLLIYLKEVVPSHLNLILVEQKKHTSNYSVNNLDNSFSLTVVKNVNSFCKNKKDSSLTYFCDTYYYFVPVCK